MDPILTGMAAKAGQVGFTAADSIAKESGAILSRLFGPAADVMGAHWAEQLKERNLARLLKKTQQRAEAAAAATGLPPGIANPRVAAQVFESAQFADQEVVAEYLSGVLASSRDPDGKNDGGVAWTSVVSRLSSDQLRLHYGVYASVRKLVLSDPPDEVNSLHEQAVVLSLGELVAFVGDDVGRRFSDAIDGLMREDLIADFYSYGPHDEVFKNELQGNHVDFEPSPVLKLGLTVHGIRLFLWGNGAGALDIESYKDAAVLMEPTEHILDPVPVAFADKILRSRSA